MLLDLGRSWCGAGTGHIERELVLEARGGPAVMEDAGGSETARTVNPHLVGNEPFVAGR